MTSGQGPSAMLDGNPEIRRQLLQGLHDVQDLGTLRTIAEYLSDPEPAVCETAVNVLVQAGTAAAAGVAADRLRSTSPAERAYAIDTLQRLGPHAVGTLVALLGEPDEDLRKCAVDTLAAIRDPVAIPALIAALADADENVAAAAAEGLGTIGAPDAVAALKEAVRGGTDWVCVCALGSLGMIGGPAALEAICSLRADAPAGVQAAAAIAAGSVARADAGRAARFLTAFVAATIPSVVDAALIGLGRLIQLTGALPLDGPRRATVAAAAQQQLASPYPEIRVAALHVVAHQVSPDAGCILTIARLLSDDGALPVRIAAMQALAAMRSLDRPQLLNLAIDRREHVTLRLTALHLLADGQAGQNADEPSVLGRLIQDEPTLILRLAALRLLLAAGDRRAPELGIAVLAESGADDPDLLAELGTSPRADLVPLLHAVLDSEYLDRGKTFAELLPFDHELDLRSPPIESLIRVAAVSPAWRVRAHVVRLLEGCRTPWALAIIHAGCADADPRVRVRAVDALGSASISPNEQKLLSERLRDENGWVRAGALGALFQAHQLDERDLQQALEDEFALTRQSGLRAALAVVRRGGGSADFRASASTAAARAQLDDDPELEALGIELTSMLA